MLGTHAADAHQRQSVYHVANYGDQPSANAETPLHVMLGNLPQSEAQNLTSEACLAEPRSMPNTGWAATEGHPPLLSQPEEQLRHMDPSLEGAPPPKRRQVPKPSAMPPAAYPGTTTHQDQEEQPINASFRPNMSLADAHLMSHGMQQSAQATVSASDGNAPYHLPTNGVQLPASAGPTSGRFDAQPYHEVTAAPKSGPSYAGRFRLRGLASSMPRSPIPSDNPTAQPAVPGMEYLQQGGEAGVGHSTYSMHVPDDGHMKADPNHLAAEAAVAAASGGSAFYLDRHDFLHLEGDMHADGKYLETGPSWDALASQEDEVPQPAARHLHTPPAGPKYVQPLISSPARNTPKPIPAAAPAASLGSGLPHTVAMPAARNSSQAGSKLMTHKADATSTIPAHSFAAAATASAIQTEMAAPDAAVHDDHDYVGAAQASRPEQSTHFVPKDDHAISHAAFEQPEPEPVDNAASRTLVSRSPQGDQPDGIMKTRPGPLKKTVSWRENQLFDERNDLVQKAKSLHEMSLDLQEWLSNHGALSPASRLEEAKVGGWSELPEAVSFCMHLVSPCTRLSGACHTPSRELQHQDLQLNLKSSLLDILSCK